MYSRDQVCTHIVKMQYLALYQKNKDREYIRPFLILSVICILLFSCSGADPVVYKLETTLQVWWHYPHKYQERLLVQILADDDDGFDEIYEVYVINDESEVYWRSNQDEWDLVESEGNTWIVLNNIVTDDGSNIPRGEYRVVLLDLSGYRDERIFVLDIPDESIFRHYLPVLRLQSSGVYVPSHILPNNEQISLMLEIAYPNMRKDIADNEDVREFQHATSALGKDGMFYQVERGKPIKFVLDDTQGYGRLHLYLHARRESGILYTTGPFELILNQKNLNRN